MSKTTVVYAHPYEKSFNHGILETVKAAIAAKGDELDVLDLYADGFNPVYQPQELAMFSRGEYLDPLIGRYHESLRGADRVIFIDGGVIVEQGDPEQVMHHPRNERTKSFLSKVL